MTGHGGEGQHPGVMSVAWAPDGKELASGGKDGSVLLWDRTGKVRARLKRHDESVLGVAFAPDNRRLARILSATRSELLTSHKLSLVPSAKHLFSLSLVTLMWLRTGR